MVLSGNSYNWQIKGKIGDKDIKNRERINKSQEYWQLTSLYITLCFPRLFHDEFILSPQGGSYGQNIYLCNNMMMIIIVRVYHWIYDHLNENQCITWHVPYRAKLFVWQNFRHKTKNSSLSPNEIFRPIKVKVFLNELQVNLRDKQVISKNFDHLIGRNFVGRNLRHQTKNLSHSPDEKFRPIKVKLSLNEVQMNLRGKQVI